MAIEVLGPVPAETLLCKLRPGEVKLTRLKSSAAPGVTLDVLQVSVTALTRSKSAQKATFLPSHQPSGASAIESRAESARVITGASCFAPSGATIPPSAIGSAP